MSKKWKLKKKPGDVCWDEVVSTTISSSELSKAVMVEKGLIETDEMKPKPFPYTIITNPKLAEFINNNMWWGWCLSADGSYCYSWRYCLE